MAWTSVDTQALSINDDPGEDICKRAAKEIKRLHEALRPFAGCVHNDNGDITVHSALAKYDDFVAAHFAFDKT